MKTHVQVLGWLYIVSGALGILGALALFLIIAGGGWISGDETAIAITGIVALVIAGFVVITSVPGIIAGVGLLNFKNWARILTLVLGVLNIPLFPVGTLLGVYTIWALLDDDTSRLFMPAG